MNTYDWIIVGYIFFYRKTLEEGRSGLEDKKVELNSVAGCSAKSPVDLRSSSEKVRKQCLLELVVGRGGMG